MKVEVGVVKLEGGEYPARPPFHPSVPYPEYPFDEIESAFPNHAYEGVRSLLSQLGLDSDKFGSPEWNPLGRMVEPGMTVVIKPNFVRSRHFEGKDPFSIITHPSVIRAIADYVWIALKGEGKIIVADAPQYDCNWDELMELTRLETVEAFLNGVHKVPFELRDLRNYWSRGKHFPSMKIDLPGDPDGSVRVDLGPESAVAGVANTDQLYGAVYHRSELIENHTADRHQYELSGTVMNADVVISVPKLKTHKKVGVTMNIKGLVGTCTNKNLILHYSLGRREEGGDQYPPGHFTPMEERLIRTERWMYDTFLAKRSIPLEYIHRSVYWLHGRFIKPLGIGVPKEKRLLDVGNWYGNDSAWRMCVDLMKIIVFADREGVMREEPQRRLFSIIDGITGGDLKGPLDPDPVPAGLLIGSLNFLAADIVGTRLMGFDPMKVKVLSKLLSDDRRDFCVSSFDDIRVLCKDKAIEDCLNDKASTFADFRPYPGWRGHIEI